MEEAVREIIIPRIQSNFDNESEADGTPWEPLSPVMPYRFAMGAEQNPILQVTGELRQHATMTKYWEFQGQLSTMKMVGPLDPPYWALQQYGGSNMGLGGKMGDVPARPYIGINEQDMDAIAEKLSEFALLRGVL